MHTHGGNKQQLLAPARRKKRLQWADEHGGELEQVKVFEKDAAPSMVRDVCIQSEMNRPVPDRTYIHLHMTRTPHPDDRARHAGSGPRASRVGLECLLLILFSFVCFLHHLVFFPLSCLPLCLDCPPLLVCCFACARYAFHPTKQHTGDEGRPMTTGREWDGKEARWTMRPGVDGLKARHIALENEVHVH